MQDKKRIVALVAASLVGVTLLRAASRPKRDDAHAPGHTHLGPPPDADGASRPSIRSPRNQPWVRTSHSDSQQRRFRR